MRIDGSIWNPFRGLPLTTAQTVLAVGLIFVVAGIVGWIYEELFYRVNDGYFSRRGQGKGPWLPIYAFGVVLLLFAAAPVRDTPWLVFLLCGLISGAFEYVSGWALLRFFHWRPWDYNVEIWNWGNLHGFICLRSVLVFAAGGTGLFYTLIPLIGFLAKTLPDWAYTGLCAVPFALFALDILLGYLVRRI